MRDVPAPGAVPPAAALPVQMRRVWHSTFPAAFSWQSCSRLPHRWVRSDSDLETLVPQHKQSDDVPVGGTSTNGMPALADFHFGMLKNSRQPCFAIARFRPRYPWRMQSKFLIYSTSTAMKSQIPAIRSVRQCSSRRPASAARSWVRGRVAVHGTVLARQPA